MLQLVINELRHLRSFTFVTLVLLSVLTLVSKSSGSVFFDLTMLIWLFSTPSILALSGPSLSFRAEERNDTWRLLRSLPVGPCPVVSAKFTASLLSVLIGAGVAWALLTCVGERLWFGISPTALALPVLAGVLLLGPAFALRFWLGERTGSLALLGMTVLSAATGLFAIRLGGFGAAALDVARRAAILPGLVWATLLSASLLGACWIASTLLYWRHDITRKY